MRGPELLSGRGGDAPGEGVAWLVGPGIALIALTYGLARFSYGLFLPELREAFQLSPSVLGVIGAGSYVGYCGAILVSLVLTSRTGPRFMGVAAAAVAVAGLAAVAGAPAAWVLALGILVAGSSTGLASPPMGEAVARSIRSDLQDRANTLINSGTSIGVAVSGPAALFLAGQWRLAWAAFAAVGVVVLVWNAGVLPRRPVVEKCGGESVGVPPLAGEVPPLTFSYLSGPAALPLFVAALGLGFSSAAYWTFSRDLVVQAGSLGETGSTLFWTVIGVCGLAGGAAGDLVRRLGITAALRLSLVALALSVAALAAAPGSLTVAYSSAALFGASYITLTGIVLVWSVAVFPERPSAGLGAGFLAIAAGQVAGAPAAGALAGATSLTVTFFAFAVVALLTGLIKPCRGDRNPLSPK